MVDNLITLYEHNETDFKTNGLGSLNEAASCSVHEERNGEFDLTMEYPVTGRHFSDLIMRRIIFAKPNPYSNPQPFRIYEISKPINGIITVSAHHISYDLDGYPLAPFDTSSLLEAFEEMNRQMSEPWNSGHPAFHFSTTKTGAADTFNLVAPCSARALLGGSEGTILDRWPGEYEWDIWDVRLHQNRGADRGVTIEYGKNLTDLEQEENCENCWTGVYPYYYTEPQTDDEGVTTGGLVQLDEKVLACPGDHNYRRIMILDLTSEFDEQPTQAELRERAQKYIEDNELGSPKVSLTVSFLPLSETTSYAKLKLLEEVRLCDTVHVYFPLLNVSSTSTCISTTYNVLSGKYTEIELGEAKSNLASTLADRGNETDQRIQSALNSNNSFIEDAIRKQTKLITGNSGGYVVLHDTNADGMPDELLVLDSENLQDAKNVWRWNLAGLGHSSTGYTGDYTTGWTMDGHFNASMITVGELMANLIKVGILSDKNGYNYWNMESGEFRMAATATVGGQTIPSIAQEKADSALSDAKSYSDESIGGFIENTYNPKIAELQKQLDGQIETYYYDYEPTIQNEPASLWTSDEEKARHEGDLFYWKTKGYAYRFFKDGSTWKWQLVQDTDITQALAKADAAQDTADNKRRVFVDTPKPPYDVGDLWVQGSKGDILRCQTKKGESASYSENDWILASKYTDDSTLTTFLNGDYKTTIENLSSQVDKKAETWYQSANPADSWSTTQLKNDHTGDLWYCTSSSDTTHYGKYWLWNGTAWVEMQTTPPQAVFDQIDGKAQIFINTPEPPYHEGDLWFQSDTSDIMTCIKDRPSGVFVSGDWEKRNKYIDLYSVDVGGTNLLSNTKTFEGHVGSGTIDGDYLGFTVLTYDNTSGTGINYLIGNWGTLDNPLETDTDYTLSFYIKGSGAISTEITYGNIEYGYNMVGTETTQSGTTVSKIEFDGATSEWTRYWITWHTRSSYSSRKPGIYLARVLNGAQIWICGAKFEKGNRPTDWSPSVTDVQKESENFASTAVNNQTTEFIFNKLTDGGRIKGLYMQDGQLYISFTYARGGTLALGGANNGNGLMEIYDSKNRKVATFDNEKIDYISADVTTDINSNPKYRRHTVFNSGEIDFMLKQETDSSGAIVDGPDRVIGRMFPANMAEFTIDTIFEKDSNWISPGLNMVARRREYLSGGGYGESSASLGIFYSETAKTWMSELKSRVFGIPEITTIGHAGAYKAIYSQSTGIFIGAWNYDGMSVGDGSPAGGIRIAANGNNRSTGVYLSANLYTESGASKSKLFESASYHRRAMYCYEMASPYFGDIGCGETDSTGYCYVHLDEIFQDAVNLSCNYQVFLQKEGPGDIWVESKMIDGFTVKGTPNLKFSWEVKAKQINFELTRMDVVPEDGVFEYEAVTEPNYSGEAEEYCFNFIKDQMT